MGKVTARLFPVYVRSRRMLQTMISGGRLLTSRLCSSYVPAVGGGLKGGGVGGGSKPNMYMYTYTYIYIHMYIHVSM